MARLGQHFLADTNLLEAIVREASLAPEDVVLEVGGGAGVLTRALAAAAGVVWVVEIDRGLAGELEVVRAEHPNARVVWGDAMRVDLTGLDPAPTTLVSNLPYAVATPLLLRTIWDLPGVRSWTVMVQREIADRLRAEPGTREYGAPSVLVQHACRVKLLRTVDRAVFSPRPRVDSALLRLERVGPAANARMAAVVRGAFAHRRKTLAGSLALAGVADREAAREALESAGLSPESRAQELGPGEFTRLAAALEG